MLLVLQPLSQAPSDKMGSSYHLQVSSQSETCPEAAPAFFWQFALGHCCANRCTITQPQFMETLEQVFSKDFSVFIVPSLLTSLHVSAAEMHTHSMMLPPPCFTIGRALAGDEQCHKHLTDGVLLRWSSFWQGSPNLCRGLLKLA